MFNEEMKITAENELELYIKMALKNTDFALISVDCILNTQDIDLNIYNDKHTFYFYYIQNLLAACGNICNIFNPVNNISLRVNNILRIERCNELQNKCGLNVKKFPLIFKKEVRNINMHFDEHYDEHGRRIGDYNILDENTPYDERQTILNTPHLRTYDKLAQVYITVGRFGKRIEYPLIQLRQELVSLKNLLNSSLE